MNSRFGNVKHIYFILITSLKLKALVLHRRLREPGDFLFRRGSFSTLPDGPAIIEYEYATELFKNAKETQ